MSFEQRVPACMPAHMVLEVVMVGYALERVLAWPLLAERSVRR